MIKPVVIGTSFVDIKGYPLMEFVYDGRTAGDIVYVEGGVGRNIAEDLVHMGAEPRFISLVDESGTAMSMVEHLKEEGVDVRGVKSVPDGMGMWMAIFDNRGDVYSSISKRPNLLPMVDVMNEIGDELFKDADGMLIEIDMDEPVVAKAFELADKYGVDAYAVISNISIARERTKYIQKAKCFICNAQEAGILFDVDTSKNVVTTREDMLMILKVYMKKLGVKSMVVTMDERGAVYASEDGEEGGLPAIDVKVVDTTGAGDSFFAAYAFKDIAGEKMQAACEYATKIATEVICKNSNVY